MSGLEAVLVLVAVVVSCGVSATVGLGGSLLLVPVAALALGTKEGVAFAALVLAVNNVVKVVAYRDALPVRAAIVVALLTAVGAAAGASLLVAAPEPLVDVGVAVAIVSSLAGERARARRDRLARRAAVPALALASGATSGFAGTSGPLKGVAARALGLDREHTAGAATLVSLAGDVAKTSVFAHASLLGRDDASVALAAVPLMIVATVIGRTLNRRMGEQRYAVVFWAVMTGYVVRVFVG